MKTNFKRIASLLMAIIMCFSITACQNTPKWDGKWEITDDEYEKSVFADSEVEKGKDEINITLGSDKVSFKSDISKDSIRIAAFAFSEQEVNSIYQQMLNSSDTSSDESQNDNKTVDMDSKEVLLTDYSIERRDDHTVILSFKEPDYEYACMYQYFIHKEAVNDDVFVVGVDFVDINAEPIATAEFITSLTNGEADPEIEIKLENADASENIKKEDIKLLGAIKDLEVSSLTASGDSIKIGTKGTVNITSASSAYVELSESATDRGSNVIAVADVLNLNAILDNTSYSYKDGELSFDVKVFGTKLDMSDEQMASYVKLDDFQISKVKISEDKTAFKLYLKVNSNNLADALKEIENTTLAIDSKAVGGEGLKIPAAATYASYTAKIDSMDKTDETSVDYKVTAKLTAACGKFGDIKKSDITFGGDFGNAEIVSLENDNGNYKIELSLKGQHKDKSIFDGRINIAENKLYNEWGTTSENLSTDMSYVFENDRAEAKDFIAKIKKHSDMFTDMKEILTIVFEESSSNKFAAIFNKYQAIQGVLGFIDNRSGTDIMLDEIYSAIVETRTMIANLDEKVSDVQKKISSSHTATKMGINQLLLAESQQKWIDFKTNYINPLENIITSFENGIRSKIVDYVTRSHGNELVIYYDVEDKIAIPRSDAPTKSLDTNTDGASIKIDPEKTKVLKLSSSCFDNSKDIYEDYGYCDKFEDAFLGDLLKVLEDNKNILEATEENAKILYDYIYTNMSVQLLTSGNPNNPTQDLRNQLQNCYTNFCDALIGENKVGSPLEEYYKIIYSYYNFQSEAKEDLQSINDYLTVLVFKYGTFATFAAELNPGYSTAKKPIATASAAALDFLNMRSGLRDEPEGYAWCYVVDKPITFRYIFDASYVSINNNNPPLPYYEQNRYRFNKMEFKYNIGEMYMSYDNPENGWQPDRTNTGWASCDYSLISSEKDSYKIKQGRIVNETDISIMNTRFDIMNLGKGMTFKEYLTTGKYMRPGGEINGEKVCYYMNKDFDPIIDSLGGGWNQKWFENWENYNSFYEEKKINSRINGDPNQYYVSKIITSGIQMKDFPLSEKHNLKCVASSNDGVPVTFRNDRWYDIDSEYFLIHTMLYADTYDMNSGKYTVEDIINEHAGYGESYWAWYHDIAATFIKDTDVDAYYPDYAITPQQKYLCIYY